MIRRFIPRRAAPHFCLQGDVGEEGTRKIGVYSVKARRMSAAVVAPPVASRIRLVEFSPTCTIRAK
eukprot:3001921-Pyramimonas_sp.AAC.1